MTRPSILRVETLFEGWARYLRAHVRLPDGQEMAREIEDHGDAAAVLPYDPVRRTALLVRQARAALILAGYDEDVLEAPAGLLDGEDPAACAIREAREEVGLALADPEWVGTMASLPGISTERIHIFLCACSTAGREPGGGLASEHEQITVVEVALAELASLADAGRLPDMKTFALVQTLRLRRPELFTPP